MHETLHVGMKHNTKVERAGLIQCLSVEVHSSIGGRTWSWSHRKLRFAYYVGLTKDFHNRDFTLYRGMPTHTCSDHFREEVALSDGYACNHQDPAWTTLEPSCPFLFSAHSRLDPYCLKSQQMIAIVQILIIFTISPLLLVFTDCPGKQ